MNGPAILLIQALADLRLDKLLTSIRMTYGRLGVMFVLLRYPEKLQGPSREFNAVGGHLISNDEALDNASDSVSPPTEEEPDGRR